MRHERGTAQLQRLLLRLLHAHGLRADRRHPNALHLHGPGADQCERHAHEQHTQWKTGRAKETILTPSQSMLQELSIIYVTRVL